MECLRQLDRRRALLAGVACVLTGACGGGGADAAEANVVRVAVAANFAAVHEQLAARFETDTGRVVVPVVGSTGKLYAQIVNGAPIDVFLAADEERPRRLEEEGHAVAGSRFVYAEGRLALWGPDAASPDEALRRLRDVEFRHLAIASPEVAPYGAAARRALEELGLWTQVADRVVYGESVIQAHQFVASGAAELGILALALLEPAEADRSWVLPDELHGPLRQEAVLLARAAESVAAREYLDFLRSAPAREVVVTAGYRPGDSR